MTHIESPHLDVTSNVDSADISIKDPKDYSAIEVGVYSKYNFLIPSVSSLKKVSVYLNFETLFKGFNI